MRGPRRPKRSLVDELDLHLRLTIATRSQCDVLRELHQDVPEFLTAVSVLDLAEKRLREKRQQAAITVKPLPVPTIHVEHTDQPNPAANE